jgi:predicted neuraminidase
MHRGNEPWAFVDRVPEALPDGSPVIQKLTVNTPNDEKFAHAASLITVRNGLRAFWYHATYEGAADARLDTSTLNGTNWSPSETLVTSADLSREIGVSIKSLANPVPFRHPNGELWLFFCVSRLSGWATSEILLKRSTDDGKTWKPAERLYASPFVNISHMTKTPPVLMSGNRIGVPSYFEMKIKYPVLLVLNEDGRVIDRRRMGGGGFSAIQPSIVVTGKRTAVALMRRLKTSTLHRVLVSRTTDGGDTWSAPIPTNLPNPGGAVSAIRYDANRLLIAYNDNPLEEMQVALAVSDLSGAKWKKIGEPVPENRLVLYDRVAYPYLIQSAPGKYDLVYSRLFGKLIGYAGISGAWIAERLEPRTARP